jgi:hypothetical protein
MFKDASLASNHIAAMQNPECMVLSYSVGLEVAAKKQEDRL